MVIDHMPGAGDDGRCGWFPGMAGEVQIQVMGAVLGFLVVWGGHGWGVAPARLSLLGGSGWHPGPGEAIPGTARGSGG